MFGNFLRFKESQKEHLVPFLELPEGLVPGTHTWYSTVCRQCPAGCGLKVKVREGRAKKLEGHHLSPINQGKLCSRGQAGLQVLYNPDRVKRPLLKEGRDRNAEPTSWRAALSKVTSTLGQLEKPWQIAFISEPLRGTLSRLVTSFMRDFGSKDFFAYDVYGDMSLRTASDICFGYPAIPDYQLEEAQYILSLGANFLDTWLSPVRYSVGYGAMRDIHQTNKGSRGWLVHFEPRQSLTGASADEWFPINPGTEGFLALSVAYIILSGGWHSADLPPAEVQSWIQALKEYKPERATQHTGVSPDVIQKIAREFSLAQPGLALVGGAAAAQPNGVFNAVATNILNLVVGSLGRAGGVRFPATPPISADIEKTMSMFDLNKLVDRMDSGDVQVLFVYNANPVFTAPANIGFQQALKKVPLVVSFSSFLDETTSLADVVLPDHTFLESWGDYVPATDTGQRVVGAMQPVVEPLYDTRAVGDILLELLARIQQPGSSNRRFPTFKNYLRDSWRKFYDEQRSAGLEPIPSFEDFWKKVLMNGGWWEETDPDAEIPNLPPPRVPTPEVLANTLGTQRSAPREFTHHLQIYPSSGLYDGRGANQPWLQEMPEPLVSAAWGSWVEINPETAGKLGVKEGDVVWVESASGKFKAPVYVFPAMGPGVVACPSGQGHSAYGRYARERGINPFAILDPIEDEQNGAFAWGATKVKIYPAGERVDIIKTEGVTSELGRMIVQTVGPDETREMTSKREAAIKALPTRDLDPRKKPPFLSGLGLRRYRKSQFYRYVYRWGMVIDLDKCTGCQACMIACRAENNIPTAGAEQTAKRRSINWIRVDRYWEGEYPNVRAKLIPMNCYQCANAPCEPVCPVAAPYHTPEGLNAQIYNRCIGTRFCGVNCPYQARYFNWFNPEWPKPLEQQLNPELSVRTAGIMEKCTFCVQRLRAAKSRAKTRGQSIKDGEVQPACVQTCPSGAMVFGNLVDAESQVSRLTRDSRRYRVLEEWNTEPAVIYLKAVKNDV